MKYLQYDLNKIESGLQESLKIKEKSKCSFVLRQQEKYIKIFEDMKLDIQSKMKNKLLNL